VKWEIGLSTGIAYRHPVEDVLPAIRRHGFRTIEVSTAPPHLDVADVPRIRRLKEQADGLGLRVHSLHAPFGHDVNFTSPEESDRRYALRRLTLAADALHLLGGAAVRHPSGRRGPALGLGPGTPPRPQRRGPQHRVEGLSGPWTHPGWWRHRCPISWAGSRWISPGSSNDFRARDRRVRGHFALLARGSLMATIATVGSRLVHVQASDNRGQTDDHLPPRDGVIDWTAVTGRPERGGLPGCLHARGHGRRETSSPAWPVSMPWRGRA
jgi:sugar phosphate isomerase/epimerase